MSIWLRSAVKPSEISIQLLATPRSAKPSATRGVGVVNAAGVMANNDSGRGWCRERQSRCRGRHRETRKTQDLTLEDPGGKSGNAVARTNAAPVPLHRDISYKGTVTFQTFVLPGVEIDVGIMTELATSSLVDGGASFQKARKGKGFQAMRKNECDGGTKKQKIRQTVAIAQKKLQVPPPNCNGEQAPNSMSLLFEFFTGSGAATQ